jgi:hypothetical protein
MHFPGDSSCGSLSQSSWEPITGHLCFATQTGMAERPSCIRLVRLAGCPYAGGADGACGLFSSSATCLDRVSCRLSSAYPVAAAFGGKAVVLGPLSRITQIHAPRFPVSGEKLTMWSLVDLVCN